jgi:hypothetical protein
MVGLTPAPCFLLTFRVGTSFPLLVTQHLSFVLFLFLSLPSRDPPSRQAAKTPFPLMKHTRNLREEREGVPVAWIYGLWGVVFTAALIEHRVQPSSFVGAFPSSFARKNVRGFLSSEVIPFLQERKKKGTRLFFLLNTQGPKKRRDGGARAWP